MKQVEVGQAYSLNELGSIVAAFDEGKYYKYVGESDCVYTNGVIYPTNGKGIVDNLDDGSRTSCCTTGGEGKDFVLISDANPQQDWYDYENQVAISAPPTNTECEYDDDGTWTRTVILAHHPKDKDTVWHQAIECSFSDGRKTSADSCIFLRPLDWDRELKRERDELIAQAMMIADKAQPECDMTFIEALLDAGWRPTQGASQ